ncbi:MAG: glycosyltransferase family 2 protein [candidate division SR1 bacterium]|nr:glycosyltransferase family 2 protein [candidate division SR1 bacterium]
MGFVSIIIVNYNGKDFNSSCINSILKQSYQDFEIIFVDNASSDGSLEEVNETYQKEIKNNKLIIIKNDKNTGFAGGNNVGVLHANKKSEYICLLNNDTTVPENWLEELIIAIELDKELGAVGSIILNKGMERKTSSKTFNNKEINTSSFFGDTVRKKIPEKEFKTGIFYTAAISGCCFLYRKEIIDTPFEEYYFAYAEDIFLSWLIISCGYKIAYVAKSLVYHIGSGSFGKSPSDIKLFHGNKNQIINYIIFYNIGRKILLFPLFIGVQLSHIFINHPRKRIKSKYESWKRIYKNRSKLSTTKRHITTQKKISQREFISKLSYKFNDEVFYTSQKKRQINMIVAINKIYKIYCYIFGIPYTK